MFKQWLKKQNGDFRDPLQEDFTEDVLADKDFPNVQGINELETYLLCKGACGAAIDAGIALFNTYLNELEQTNKEQG